MYEIQNITKHSSMLFDCTKTFHDATGLTCTISTDKGNFIEEYGYGCKDCQLCNMLNIDKSTCVDSHIYAMSEASRFGGKYIYMGPCGLSSFVSPVVNDFETKLKINVGPFLMVDVDDFIEIDLKHRLNLSNENIEIFKKHLEKIPKIDPSKVHGLSNLLFMTINFFSNTSDFYKVIEMQEQDYVQQKILSNITDYKDKENSKSYPFHTENCLLDCVASADKINAQKYLNEIYGYIFFSTSGNLLLAKSRVYELLILISRTAIKSGADSEQCMLLTHDYIQIIPKISSMDELCIWLSKITNNFMDKVFSFLNIKHQNVIQKAVQYIYSNYNDKITLESISSMVFLSPTYFSKIFKEEMNTSFVTFLNGVRVEQSKRFLRDDKIKLVDISNMVGFEDQSYFTKVFKKNTNLTPLQYRKKALEK